MNIQAEKIQLAKMLLETENPKIIDSIKKIFKKENATDFWDDLMPEQREEIEKALMEIKNGEVIAYKTFIQKHR
ncbi:MAG: hypothetical protein COZ75_07940 [Flavobacteriaceae bacterium CG_4_8_14_3_um_filter_34_10]|nr:hypothetical protein [Flavobacteriia bacterium]OIP49210.1 MAG: hypothetical protein AUK33_10975 [Flavobacteriaceae bacterium CG2_30_34_30]PIQ19083.1 MAG: hypothetical protein COW66_02930 [Flavobacteriaceae bacterium CG18_big_fil_WC_8_21_14_2_50_34_36]PIX09226.1 MAG: hypothetical protein COZ75_07940 [Flavobacteriaceae bacterium CG_4_8_14_3_um_filter_34_10]PIZ08097.1 MAG: hypothetical protein COY56_05685 [Flavobacteriaceae bacterium CG_4_10_14_0_8_um_filter_34_31]PJC06667.1 MAG: hypothetical 